LIADHPRPVRGSCSGVELDEVAFDQLLAELVEDRHLLVAVEFLSSSLLLW
jgi:hypothetical protein